MSKENKKQKPENNHLNAELGGMGLYGTTGNVEIAGYKATGDIENAGQPEKGLEKEKAHRGSVASVQGTHQKD